MDVSTLVIDLLHLVLWLAAPALGACLLVGLLMGVVQTATQASDPSVSFVPKLLAVGLALFLSRAFLAHELVDFSSRLFHGMAQLGR